MHFSFELRPDLAEMNIFNILSLLDADLIQVQYLLQIEVSLQSFFFLLRLFGQILNDLNLVYSFTNIINDSIPTDKNVSDLS